MSSSPETLSDFLPSPTLSHMTAVTLPSPSSHPVDFDAEHYWDFVTFKVEGRLFRVPKYRFVEESEHFSTLFDLEDKLGQEYGLDDPHLDAVKIEDVTIGDFQTFLKVLYPRNVESPPVLTQEEWMLVLVLSTKWRFGDIRQRAIKEIKAVSSLSEQIRLAEELTIPFWLTGAYTDLVKREVALTLAEAEQLGSVKTLALFAIREKYSRSRCVHVSSGMNSDAIVREVNAAFAVELDGMRKKEAELYPTKEQRRAIEEAVAKAEHAARSLLEKEAASKMDEERNKLAEQYEKALEEQRVKLAMLEQEKERALGIEGLGITIPAEDIGAQGAEYGEIRCAKKKKGKGLKKASDELR